MPPMPKFAAAFVVSVLTATPALAQIETANPNPSPDRGVVTRPAAERAQPSVVSLFRDLGGDFKRLPSWETAIVLGAAGSVSAGVSHRDAELSRQAVASQTM